MNIVITTIHATALLSRPLALKRLAKVTLLKPGMRPGTLQWGMFDPVCTVVVSDSNTVYVYDAKNKGEIVQALELLLRVIEPVYPRLIVEDLATLGVDAVLELGFCVQTYRDVPWVDCLPRFFTAGHVFHMVYPSGYVEITNAKDADEVVWSAKELLPAYQQIKT